jgi:hypothetical protein
LQDADQSARRDRLGEVARGAIDAFESREWDPSVLVDELAPAGRGRHVLVWSANPVEQRGWEASGIAGDLKADSMLVSLMNFGGNKLDQFVTIDGAISIDEQPAGVDVAVRLTITNKAPVGEPAYVVGPHPNSGVGEGVYLGILSVNVPGAASGLKLEGATELVAAGPDGRTQVMATNVQLARGETREFVVRFRAPAGATSFRVEPSAREPTITWSHGGEEWQDDHVERVEW